MANQKNFRPIYAEVFAMTQHGHQSNGEARNRLKNSLDFILNFALHDCNFYLWNSRQEK
jgi:hypothetical protein